MEFDFAITANDINKFLQEFGQLILKKFLELLLKVFLLISEGAEFRGGIFEGFSESGGNESLQVFKLII